MEVELLERYSGLTLRQAQQRAMSEWHSLAHEYRDIVYQMPFQLPTDLLFVGRAMAILLGEYGLGRILVETAHPNALTDCPFSDQVYIRMIEWLLEREVWQVYLPLTVRDW